MSNRSYLCGTNLQETYPSFVDPDYDPDEQTLACDVYCVPLLWLGMFRPADIVAKTFTVPTDEEDETVEVPTEAPLVERAKAIAQLKESLAYFNKLFAKEGSLDDYHTFLLEVLETADYQYVTIELQEVAALEDSEQEFYDTFRAALAGIGNDFSPEAKQRLVDIAQFQDLEKFPPARMLLDDLEAEDEDYWNHCRVCGAGENVSGLGRAVPWEPE